MGLFGSVTKVKPHKLEWEERTQHAYTAVVSFERVEDGQRAVAILIHHEFMQDAASWKEISYVEVPGMGFPFRIWVENRDVDAAIRRLLKYTGMELEVNDEA